MNKNLGKNNNILKQEYKKNGIRGAVKTAVILASVNSTVYAADDDVFLPIVTLLKVWLQGNLGYAIALLIIAGGIIYGAFGGGVGTAMKAMFFGLLVGAIVFIVDKVWNVGLSFA